MNTVNNTSALFGQTELRLKTGDITEEIIDAIVNAANSTLLGGGGVDGAIHRAGGPAILEECKKLRAAQGKCPPGQAVITSAGNLNARFVIHTVGPIWQGGNRKENQTLQNAYLNSLKTAASAGAASIAFPSISTGAYRFPVKPAAEIALQTCINFALSNSSFKEIRFVLFNQDIFNTYKSALEQNKTQ